MSRSKRNKRSKPAKRKRVKSLNIKPERKVAADIENENSADAKLTISNSGDNSDFEVLDKEKIKSSTQLDSLGNAGQKLESGDSAEEKIRAAVSEASKNSEELIELKVSSLAESLKTELLREWKDLLKKNEKKYNQIDEAVSELINVGDDRRDFINRYKPGTIEQQSQQIDYLTADNQGLRDQLKTKNDRIDAAERELDLFKARTGQKDIEELESIKDGLRVKIEKLRLEHGNFENLLLECQQLKTEKLDLEEIQSKHDRATATQEDNNQLREEKLRLEVRVDEVESEKQRFVRKNEIAEKKMRSAENKRDSLGQELSHLNSEMEETTTKNKDLAAKVQSHDELAKKFEQANERVRELENELVQEQGRSRDKLLEQQERESVRRESFESLMRADLKLEFQNKEKALESKVKELESTNTGLSQQIRDWSDKYGKESKAFRDVGELERKRNRIESQNKELLDKEIKLDNDIKSLRESVAQLEGERNVLMSEVSWLEKRLERIREEVKNKERAPSREERIEVMLQSPRHIQPGDRLLADSENKWLNGTFDGIKNSGFYFPERLLKAFHTSLKIADWSSLTILAGVSGTGKSELPKLYSRFGGMNFIGVPVQPNWDTPADLFGFYDYLSEQFKPTELLRSMIQCDEGRSSSDSMLLVLLDEMNLARVELYFSELLSRLENRRHKGESPLMPIDIGPGVTSYELKLRNNLLFVGTINEDESTNTLSDKVLDRSNVIYFPRPKNLATRDNDDLAAIQSNRLSLSAWNSWQEPVITIPQAVRERIKNAFEEINEGLSLVNRAVAHRILQITERYIANYPDFRNRESSEKNELWVTPFEDQVAQKLMPKLRGISTKSKNGRDCIDIIKDVIQRETPGLISDFDIALESGHGQFLWSSSAYLENGAKNK